MPSTRILLTAVVACAAAIGAVVANTQYLKWESAGTDEPGDQHADSLRPHSYWAIGPNYDGSWSVCLCEYESGEIIHQDSAPNEKTAKLLAWALDPSLINVRLYKLKKVMTVVDEPTMTSDISTEDGVAKRAAQLKQWEQEGYGDPGTGSDLSRWHRQRLTGVVLVEADGNEARDVPVCYRKTVCVGDPVKHYGQRWTGCATGFVTGFSVDDHHNVKVHVRRVDTAKYRNRFYIETQADGTVQVKDSSMGLDFCKAPDHEHIVVATHDNALDAQRDAVKRNGDLLETDETSQMYASPWDWDRTEKAPLI